MTDEQPIKQPIWEIEITALKEVPKIRTFRTKITAANLEEAFNTAKEKTQAMKTTEPETEFIITGVKMA